MHLSLLDKSVPKSFYIVPVSAGKIGDSYRSGVVFEL